MRGRKLLVAALVVLGGVLALAGPAGAHTSLERSQPADRTISAAPPETLTLVFADAVDPRSVTVEVKAIDGTTVGRGVRRTPDGASTDTVVFDLPPLEQGTYGLAWLAVGDDGHQVRGETVVGVGDAADAELAAEVEGASFAESDPLGRMLELGAGLARSAWYVGLSLVAGAVYVLWWRRRAAGGVERSPTVQVLAGTAAWWSRAGADLALVAALAGSVVVVAARLRYVDTDGSLAARAVEALRAGPAFQWAVAALALVAMRGSLRRLRQGDGDPVAERSDLRLVAFVGLLGAAASVQAGHAATSDAPVLDLVSLTAHLVAAALWVGPLTIVSLTAVMPAWRAVDRADRRAALAGFWSRYAGVAFAAFATLAVTGASSAWVSLDGRWLQNAYGWVLAGKLLLIVAVVVPLALHHDRVVRSGARAAPSPDAPATGAARGPRTDATAPAFLRSVRVEAVALVLVLGLASLLGGLDPAAGGARAEPAAGAALLDDAPVDDVAECAAREIGKPTCYREYFRSVMQAEGADVAVAEIGQLAATDEYVKAGCHQITHDLGADAVEHYGDLGRTLAFEASACWSGYYHGAVETELSRLDDVELAELVPRVCDEPARERYSFTHYNCVHGVGHGLMLRFDGDLWTTMPYCDAYADGWERRSCLGGVFMQNIIGAQEGRAHTLRDDDLLYPCTELEGVDRSECLGMQTSWALYQLGYDYAAGFRLCDGLDPSSAADCYRSMGRDISGASLGDVEEVVARCDLGAEAHRESCIVGAALDAVYDDHGTARATRLCHRVDPRWQEACRRARDSAARTL